MSEIKKNAELVCITPDGFSIYRKPNSVGGHEYWSDETAPGVMIWDTSITYETSFLCAALVETLKMSSNEGIKYPLNFGGVDIIISTRKSDDQENAEVYEESEEV